MSLKISLTPPYDPELSLGIWLRHPLEKVDIVEDLIYRRLFKRQGRFVLFQMELGGTVDSPFATLNISEKVNDSDIEWAEDTARWIVHERAPMEQFISHLRMHDPKLATLCNQLIGLRPPQSPELFDTMVFAIVGQQVNLNFAYQCKSRLEEQYAQKKEINGRTWIAGLQPEDFDSASQDDLRALKISYSKGRAILELAEAFRENPLDRHNLDKLSKQEIVDKLTAFRGVGPWTAEYCLVRALAYPDSLPAGDAGLQNAIKQYYDIERPDEAEVRRMGKCWKPYRSLTTFYLWTSLMNK